MSSSKPIILWLSLICLMVYAMVLVGGITRLTESGLSMVEWRPITGFFPPTSQAEWNRVFDLYKLTPEFQLINSAMSLGEFKFIFFWEWFHRFLGRLVGIVYFFPLLYFQWRGYFNKQTRLAKKLWLGLLLGGSQGVLGWYMVKSGLVGQPDVSHYRLAAHLSLALFIFCYLFWILLSLLRKIQSESSNATPICKPAQLFLGVLSLQIVWGAFTAGLKAGYGHNTFPDMSGQFFPQGALKISPLWLNFFENHAAVQFTHRSLGWILVLLAIYLVIATFHWSKNSHDRFPAMVILSGICFQFLLGVGVLLLKVPLELAVLHQSGAFFLLLVTLVFVHLHRFPHSKRIS